MGEVITLGRLSREAIAELSRAMLGSTDDRLVDFLAEQTEGNVFFLVEVVRSLTQDAGSLGQVPQMSLPQTVAAEGIQRVVERRISRIPPGLLPRIRAAAVAGRRVDLALMRHLYPQGAPVDWLMQAESVLEVQENRWRFAHDKLRDGILERIPTEEVPTYHEQVAEGIETLYGAERAAALVEHWHIAGRRDKERTYAHRAAEQMLQVDDMQGAKAMAERALALAGEEHEALRGELLTIKAAVLSTEGDYEQAVTVLNDALELLDDPVRKSNVLTDQTEAHIRQTQYAQAEEAANTALAFARDAADYKAECDALLQLGQVNWIQSRYDEGEPYARQALAIGEEKDDKVVISNALNTLATIISRRDSPTQAIDLQERALRLKQEMGDRRGAAIMMNNLGVTARKTEQFAKSAAYYAQAVAIFQEIGFLWGVVAVSGNRGHVERQLGHYEQARQSYMTALKGSLTFNARPSMLQGLVGLADCYIQVGEPRPAATLMGLVMQHENYDDDVKIVAEPVFERLQKALPTEERIPLMEKGAALDLVDTVKQVTTGTFNAQ
jgi:tetratricopeptide (TPR) repeat protein